MNLDPLLLVIAKTDPSTAEPIPCNLKKALLGDMAGLGELVKKKLPVAIAIGLGELVKKKLPDATTGADGDPVTTNEPVAKVPATGGEIKLMSACLLFWYTPNTLPSVVGLNPNKV